MAKRGKSPVSSALSDNVEAFQQRCIAAGIAREAIRPGLQAVANGHPIVIPEKANRDGSLDLDAYLQASLPRANRWDYCIGCAGMIYWVEVHPAHSKNVSEMLAKLKWLSSWLARDGAPLREAQLRLYWVATKGVDILPNSRQAHKLTQSGIKGPMKRLSLRE